MKGAEFFDFDTKFILIEDFLETIQIEEDSYRSRIVNHMLDTERELSTNQIRGDVRGSKYAVLDALEDLVEDNLVYRRPMMGGIDGVTGSGSLYGINCDEFINSNYVQD